ncbi:MAG: hypothetical protein M1838_002113 [Thelocarpon superellum]|nr:MAG: hypothetical protein M1838_002113 [Thelocarpon superellum]
MPVAAQTSQPKEHEDNQSEEAEGLLEYDRDDADTHPPYPSVAAGAVFAEVILQLATLWLHANRRRGGAAAAVGLVTWCYVLLLTSTRLLRARSPRPPSQDTLAHTTLLYGILWLCSVIILRSHLIHPRSPLAQAVAVADGALLTLLAALAAGKGGDVVVGVETEQTASPSREPLASLFSRASFSWADDIVWTGYHKTLELADVWSLAPPDRASAIVRDFRQVKRTSDLSWHLLRHTRRRFLIQAAWAVVSGLLTFAPTLLLQAILRYLEDPTQSSPNVAWLFVILLLLSGCCKAIADGQSKWIGRKMSLTIRAVLVEGIYAKALRRHAATRSNEIPYESKVSAAPSSWLDQFISRLMPTAPESQPRKASQEGPAPAQASVGTIINLMAVDCGNVIEATTYLYSLCTLAPVQFTVAIVLLYRILGFSAIVGVMIMLLMVPINLAISKGFGRIQSQLMAATDARMQATNEVLQNLRVVKYFAWETRCGQSIDQERRAELRVIQERCILWLIAATVWFGAPLIITFMSFLLYTMVEKKDLLPSIAFPALSLFTLLRLPLDQLTNTVAKVQEAHVSVNRIEKFLAEAETDKYQQLEDEEEKRMGPVIGLKNATLTWGGRADAHASRPFTLARMNIDFVVGGLNLIIGPTGSGKTSLLMALLGEMSLRHGTVFLPQTLRRETLRPDPATGLTDGVAYCAQQAWLLNATIRHNILFGRPYDEDRYREVLVACALEHDLDILDAGDATLVGEKGVTLSGGQKQRVALARALYSTARHLLLDDCLSAVDAHTGKWIFDRGIRGRLMADRTCILVTHDTALCLPHARHIVTLDQGSITAQGPPAAIWASGVLGDEALHGRSASEAEGAAPRRATRERVARPPPTVGERDGTPPGAAERNGAAAYPEGQRVGQVRWKVIRLYLTSMGPWYYWVGVVGICIGKECSTLATQIWIQSWADASQSARPIGGAPRRSSEVDGSYYLGGLALIGLIAVLVSLSKEAALFVGCLRASTTLHRQLVASVSHAVFSFVDSTPLGQLTNRFSKDMDMVDHQVAQSAIAVLHCLIGILAVIILTSVITPTFLVVAIPVCVLYFVIGRFYIGSARDLKRLESIQRSPLYQHFGDTLSGITTIRAYGHEQRFVQEALRHVDQYSRPSLFMWATNQWLAFRVDVVGALVTFCASALIISDAGTISAGAAGLCLTYAVGFTENVLWLVQLYGINEQNINSVERIQEYLEIEQEGGGRAPAPPLPAGWPMTGAVRCRDYSARYRRDLPLVLDQVTFCIRPLQKVGVVGRTGAGKSSLAMALLRGVEGEEGSIEIDDVEIGTMGLQDLRKMVAFVPQDPTLFRGTIRSNLDPFNTHPDEDVFTALRQVQLIESPAVTPASSHLLPLGQASNCEAPGPPAGNIFLRLDSPVTEQGGNLSQGQKQLLCLARAILRKPKLIVMDEATASIDHATDAKLQATMREEVHSTIITIAHRLHTVIDYDRILVLDRGKVQEYQHPWMLLQDENSLFRALCEATGDLTTLQAMAEKAWRERGEGDC